MGRELHKNSEVEDEEVEWEVDVVVDMVATEVVKEDMEVDHMEVANKVDMEVAREVMAEEEHKDTIKAFKHLSSPHSSLYSKTIFGNVMYALYLYLYSNPYSDVELLLHQPKSATLHTFSLKKCFINLFQKTFLRQTLFDDKLFCIRQSNQKKCYHQFRKKKFEILLTPSYLY